MPQLAPRTLPPRTTTSPPLQSEAAGSDTGEVVRSRYRAAGAKDAELVRVGAFLGIFFPVKLMTVLTSEPAQIFDVDPQVAIDCVHKTANLALPRQAADTLGFQRNVELPPDGLCSSLWCWPVCQGDPP